MADEHRPTVLVIDDDAAVRRTLGAMVEHLGYVPRLAAGGDEGVAVYGRHRGEIAAVLLDVQMPGKDGPQTLAELRDLDPGVPCVFVSGNSGRYSRADLERRGASVLPKPPALPDLGRAIRDAIGGSAAGRLASGADDTLPNCAPLPPE